MSGELIKIRERLSRKGIELTKEQLEEAIMKFAIEKEDELTKTIEEKKSNEMLKRWLETPVRVEKTDAVEEHNTVV